MLFEEVARTETPIDELLRLSVGVDKIAAYTTRLHNAIYDNRLLDMVSLLKYGADENLPVDGLTAVQFAALHGHSLSLRILASTGKADFLVRDGHGRRPSALAFSSGGEPYIPRYLRMREMEQARAFDMGHRFDSASSPDEPKPRQRYVARGPLMS